MSIPQGSTGLPEEDLIKVKITLGLPDRIRGAATRVGEQFYGRGHRITLPSEAVRTEVLGFTAKKSDLPKIQETIEAVKKTLGDFKAFTQEQIITVGETGLAGRVSLSARSVAQGNFRQMKRRIFEALQKNDVLISAESDFDPQIPIATSSFEQSRREPVAEPVQWDVQPKEQLGMEVAGLPAGSQPPLAMEAESKKFISSLSGERTTLERICGDQDIRRLYSSVYPRQLPTKEEIQQLPAEKITEVVQDLAHAVAARNVVLCGDPSSKPISLTEVYDAPEILKWVLEDLVRYKRKKDLERLDEAGAELKRLKCSIFPDQLVEYQHLEKDIQSLRESLLRGIGSTEIIEERLKKFSEEIVEKLRRELNVSLPEAKQIFEGASTNWKGFVDIIRNQDGSMIAKQKQGRTIKGLKIYFLPGTEILVADFAKTEVGKGSYKRAKAMMHIGPSGVEESVRLTSLSKWNLADFTEEATKELTAREKLFVAKVPHIAGITAIRYMNSKGQIKTRYVMQRYASDAARLAESGKQAEAIQCCRDVATALAAMHAAGLVHLDVKGENVLTDGKRGCLSDFGLLRSKGDTLPYQGTYYYIAPEAAESATVSSSAMDMYSFGVFLLSALDPDLYAESFGLWRKDQWFLTRDQHIAFVMDIRKKIIERAKVKKDGRYLLIHDLLNPSPDKRPTAEETRRRLLEPPYSGKTPAP